MSLFTTAKLIYGVLLSDDREYILPWEDDEHIKAGRLRTGGQGFSLQMDSWVGSLASSGTSSVACSAAVHPIRHAAYPDYVISPLCCAVECADDRPAVVDVESLTAVPEEYMTGLISFWRTFILPLAQIDLPPLALYLCSYNYD